MYMYRYWKKTVRRYVNVHVYIDISPYRRHSAVPSFTYICRCVLYTYSFCGFVSFPQSVRRQCLTTRREYEVEFQLYSVSDLRLARL